MVKKLMVCLLLSSIGLPTPGIGGASGHSGHGSNGTGGAKNCQKVGIMEMDPAPLSVLAPGATFSLYVAGAKNAEDIEMTVKKIPVPIKAVDKDRFFEVTATLPAELRGVAARVNVKVKSTYAACEYDNGWLYKISE